MRLRKASNSLFPTAAQSDFERHDGEFASSSWMRDASVLRTMLGVVVVLFVAAYGISNLILGVSLSLYDPETTIGKAAVVNSEEKKQQPSHTATASRSNNTTHRADNSTTTTTTTTTTFGLNIVTMNIAGTEPSKSAPDSWSSSQQQEALLTAILASNPDVIALQECPTGQWAAGTFDNGDNTKYSLVGGVPSHAGFVSLLIRNGLQAEILELDNLPMAAATIFWQGRRIVVASVHLEPFEQGSSYRKEQLQTLITESVGADFLIFAGDTNMRDAEDASIESLLPLTLMDAWKLAGAPFETKFTWDTTPHHDAKGKFQWQNLYYGAKTRAYQCRYDRIYIGDLGTTSSSLRVNVPAFELIANQPVSHSPHHFLSDHFGIASRLELAWGTR